MTSLILLAIRLGLMWLPSFNVDMDAWIAWSQRLAELGFAHFYSDSVWTQYTPGYLYWLWLVGKLGWVGPGMVKLSVIMADLVTAKIITVVVGGSARAKKLLYVAYVLSPVILWDGAVWGQIDGILTMFMVLAIFFLVEKKNWLLSWVSFSLALLMKPQAIAILPVMLIVTIVKLGWGKLLMGLSLTGLLQLVGYLPFFPNNAWQGMITLLQKMSVSYSYTSLFAFNVWSFVGMWQNDAITWVGKSYASWGIIMIAIAWLIMIMKLIWQRPNWRITAYYLAMMACWIFFLFPTRVHERYLFPMFAFGTIVVGMEKKKLWIILFGLTTLIYFLNLYLPYSYYEPATNWLTNQALEKWIEESGRLWGVLLVLIWIMWILLFPARKNSKILRPKGRGKSNIVKHGDN